MGQAEARQLVEKAQASYRRVFMEEWGYVPSAQTNNDVHDLAHSVPKLAKTLDAALEREEQRKRAYEEFIDDAVWLSDEGETETVSVNKAQLGALIDAFDEGDV